MKFSKGFTIIELLVVIAIIAVLAAVVMVNVTSYINKGKDAAIKANLSTVRTAAAAYYDTVGNYTSLTTADTSVAAAITAITSANSAPVSNVSTTAYCMSAALKAGGSWCVDSTGFAGTLVANKCTGTVYTCQ